MRPRRKPGCSIEELPDDQAVVLSADQSAALMINGMGSVIWQLCDGERSSTAICSFLCEALPGTKVEAIERDVVAFLQELLRADLIEDCSA